MSLGDYLNVYEFETELPGLQKKVKYKGLSTNSMKKLLSYENETDPLKEEILFDDIIKISMIDKEENIDDWYLEDRIYFFIKLRESTKGSNYQFEKKCEKCNSKYIQNIDLSELDVIKKPNEPLMEKIVLESGLSIFLNHPTRKKQKHLINSIPKNIPKRDKMVDISLANYVAFVEYIEDKDSKKIDFENKELIEFIGSLPEKEIEKFNDWIDKNLFGVELKSDMICPNCGNKEITKLPIKNFFS